VTKFSGGAGGDRTPYLLNAIEALSLMSYSPTVITIKPEFSYRKVNQLCGS
ncbi:uncharacterized protein METZ01_LOCUS232708, partial [marine metagenome]